MQHCQESKGKESGDQCDCRLAPYIANCCPADTCGRTARVLGRQVFVVHGRFADRDLGEVALDRMACNLDEDSAVVAVDRMERRLDTDSVE